MRDMKILILTIFTFFLSFAAAQKRVVCYYGSWAGITNSLNPLICTHIIYSFMGIGPDGNVVSLASQNDFGAGGNLASFITLRNRNPSVKLLVAFGGWNAGTSGFEGASRDDATRKATAANVLQFVNTYNFDGADIDWEYPRSSFSSNFIALLRELRNVLSPRGKLLTVAVGATREHVDLYYDVMNMHPLVDFINLMTYDLHTSWSATVTGNNAPLYASRVDVTDYQRQFNVDDCVNYWILKGTPRDKLILGMPLYGYSYNLQSPSNTMIGAPVSSGAGAPSYDKICTDIASSAWTKVFDNDQQVPYAFSGSTWTSYDDARSIGIKVDYLIAKNLGGAMFWSLEQDDVDGSCGGGKFPLVSLVYRRLSVNGGGSGTATTAAPAPPSATSLAPTAPPQTAAPPPPGALTCPSPTGIFPNPFSCTSFLNCFAGTPYVTPCQTGLNFNPIIKTCDYPANAPCTITNPPTTTTRPPTAAPTAAPTQAPTAAPTPAPTAATTRAPTAAPTPAPTAAPTSAPSTNVCLNKTGVVANPADCNTFYNCANNVGALMNCGSGLGFNPAISACDWKYNIPNCL